MKKILVIIFLCLNTLCYAQNAGWANFNANEFVKEIKQISNNINIEQVIKEQIKNDEELQLQDLQEPWLEEFQRLIRFSIKEDKIDAIQSIFDYLTTQYNKESIIRLKQYTLETVITESKHTTTKEHYYSNNPHAIGFVGTTYIVTFDLTFIQKYFDSFFITEIDKNKLIKVATNSSNTASFTNLNEVKILIESY